MIILKTCKFLAAAFAACILCGCAAHYHHAGSNGVKNGQGPFTCHAYGVGHRHWVYTNNNRGRARTNVIRACIRGGGVSCYIPRKKGCTPW